MALEEKTPTTETVITWGIGGAELLTPTALSAAGGNRESNLRLSMGHTGQACRWLNVHRLDPDHLWPSWPGESKSAQPRTGEQAGHASRRVVIVIRHRGVPR